MKKHIILAGAALFLTVNQASAMLSYNPNKNNNSGTSNVYNSGHGGDIRVWPGTGSGGTHNKTPACPSGKKYNIFKGTCVSLCEEPQVWNGFSCQKPACVTSIVFTRRYKSDIYYNSVLSDKKTAQGSITVSSTSNSLGALCSIALQDLHSQKIFACPGTAFRGCSSAPTGQGSGF